MSTYPATVRARATSQLSSAVIWTALAAALIGAVTVLVLSVPDSNPPSPGAVVGGRAQPIALQSRFDGGPNEGARSAQLRTNPLTAPSFDRGPRAGRIGDPVRRSDVTSPAVGPARFDGGPDEGSRGATIQPGASTRFDGGPDEGTPLH